MNYFHKEYISKSKGFGQIKQLRIFLYFFIDYKSAKDNWYFLIINIYKILLEK